MKFAIVDPASISDTYYLPKRYIDQVTVLDAVQIGSICDVASGVYAAEYVPSTMRGAVPYLRVNNVREFVPNVTPCDVEHVLRKQGWGERVCIAPGDVIIARTGTLGRAFVAPHSLAGAVMSQHLTRLQLREYSHVRAQLLAAYLNSPQGKAQVMALGSGSTRLELTHDDVSRIRIPRELFGRDVSEIAEGIVPDFEETLAGANAAFDACNSLVAMVDALEMFFLVDCDRTALIESLVPRYHCPSYASVEARLSAEFECVPLGQLAQVRRGAGSLAAEYESSGVPYIRTSSIVNYGIELFPQHYGTEETYRAHRQNVGPGDVLLTIEGKIGAVAFLGVDERCLIKNHIEVIRLHRTSPVSAEFVYAFLHSHFGQAQIARRTVIQTTIPGLGSGSRSLLIPIAGRTAKSHARFANALAAATRGVQRSQAARTRLRTKLNGIVSALGQEQSVAVSGTDRADTAATPSRPRSRASRQPESSTSP